MYHLYKFYSTMCRNKLTVTIFSFDKNVHNLCIELYEMTILGNVKGGGITHTGRLAYNETDNRYCILYNDKYGDGAYNFHCGDCLDVKLNDVWIPTRIEMGCSPENNGWYLVGFPEMPQICTPIRT